jgi:hypothetical protein
MADGVGSSETPAGTEAEEHGGRRRVVCWRQRSPNVGEDGGPGRRRWPNGGMSDGGEGTELLARENCRRIKRGVKHGTWDNRNLYLYLFSTNKKNEITRKNWYVSFGSDDRAPHREFATPTRSLRGPKVQRRPCVPLDLGLPSPNRAPNPLLPSSPVAAALALPLPHRRLNRVRGPGTPPSSSRIAAAASRDRHRRHPGALPPRCQLSLSFGPLPSLSPSYRAKGRQQRFRRSSLSPVAGTTLEMEVDRGIGVRL